MNFFVKLTDAMASRQSLLITGLDPNPEMLQTWTRHHPSNGSFLAQARRWIKAVIDATGDHVCAYKPSLGFYQALGPIGIELLHEVRELVPRDMPLILDAKHGDLNTSSALAHYVFRELGADALTLSPLAGQDIVAPFLLYPERAVVITCHSSNPGARVFQHHPDEERPLYTTVVRESQLWATAEQLLLEVGTSDPAVLARVRSEAPERFLILRSLWEQEERLEALLQAGLNASGDGLLLPLPQHLLVQKGMAAGTSALRSQIETMRHSWLSNVADRCELWLPAPVGAADTAASGDSAEAALEGGEDDVAASKGAAREGPAAGRRTGGSGAVSGLAEREGAGSNSRVSSVDPLDELIVELFDVGCLLFGEYVQASGAIFNYYIDLRQIISDPNLFHRVLHAYTGQLEGLRFDRIAGIPYGSLPTATGLSLKLHLPLIYPRKEVKAHGARRLIEGDFNEGETVVVVDDILITGGSVLEGIAKLETSGLVVHDVVVFIDHGGQARQRLAKAGYRTHAVLTIPRITSVLVTAGRLNSAQAALLDGGAAKGT
ncbi:bifunctional orotidine-5'-phosphate decarboxylase/orotate phosphoribosyltransferase [Synechococcus sp. ATX 2A4]|uniref:bifunctional orotidine-5'-phosphate decarboxylase/orotate phosphoribosyltransferase n=1 Tax=Synechococcus sp. ATX 2A4 TaxID=2823727 RepID=UPI0020CCA1F3|nr:bifunctional orotidine-5'-phosphate decarboxylase/orotate phosphoribosyltransferase [Synechococcus sp. ATX 2A4]MCP9883577.1 bifunctional orotidine-5'-phosphate decarboxylase/orotate phosphoribosyltransferase [Synechococcus sp. ATX 2A4]